MFETEINVKLHDTDAAGMLFFANHFRIAHTAYEDFMKSINCSLDYIIRESDYLIPIVHAEADYERGLYLGEKFTISLKAEVGQTSFTLSYLFKDEDGNVAARLRTVHVTISKKNGEKIPLPENVRQGLRK
ncbi:MAG: acyl-CoA thioesterase [Desulfobacterales bacterium]|nr:acyl-CoA thioesterase [Desulfobacterales bacterium]